MPNNHAPTIPFDRIACHFWQYRLRWTIPAAVVFTLVFFVALFSTPTWQAYQAVLVRDEAAGGITRPGRFDNPDEMKTLQETIMELVKSRPVIEGALKRVGPTTSAGRSANWPSPRDIEKTRKSISLSAPNGAEFGKTEVFYLSVDAKSRERAIELTQAIYSELEKQMAKVRDDRANSLVAELAKTTTLAESDLNRVVTQLSAIESRVGNDLAELRVLNESSAGESNVRRTIVEVENEIRQADLAYDANIELVILLLQAKIQPSRLVATPNRLLESQPGIRRLKEGLIDAQLATSRLMGRMSNDHPSVKSARYAEDEVKRRLHQELDVAISGMKVELRLSRSHRNSLYAKRGELHGRMNAIAGERATYHNLLTEVANRREIVSNANRELAEARATQAAANAASLITAIDAPQTGLYPVSLGRTKMVLFGAFGALAFGFGIVALTTNVPWIVDESPASAPNAHSRDVPAPLRTRAKATGNLPISPRISLKQALSDLARRVPSQN